MNKKFNAVICVAFKDAIIVKKVMKYVNQNIGPQKTYLILNKRLFWLYDQKFLKKERIELLDEEKIVPGMSCAAVQQICDEHFSQKEGGGWYYQQFLKMGFALTPYADEQYLIWDSDNIPTSKFDLFDEQGRIIFRYKNACHQPYFETMPKITGLGKVVDVSFIAEHMLIKTRYMRDLIELIGNCLAEGDVWWKKIIKASPADKNHTFSEFETYGTYVYVHYPNEIVLQKLHTFRRAGKLFGRAIKEKEIALFDGVLEILSIEAGDFPPFPRNIYQFAQLLFLHLLKP